MMEILPGSHLEDHQKQNTLKSHKILYVWMQKSVEAPEKIVGPLSDQWPLTELVPGDLEEFCRSRAGGWLGEEVPLHDLEIRELPEDGNTENNTYPDPELLQLAVALPRIVLQLQTETENYFRTPSKELVHLFRFVSCLNTL